MIRLHAIVKRGQAAGTVLRPHRHADSCFVVSKTRFEKDYIRVSDEALLMDWVRQGYSVRMSNVDVRGTRSPSLIAPSSIQQEHL
jgi:hypothetical protein